MTEYTEPSSFLALEDKTSLHIWPKGGILFYNKSDKDKLPEVVYINTPARDLLILCDGTKTINDILKELQKTYKKDNFEQFTAFALLLLKEAIDKNHIRCYNTPKPIKINTTGSLKGYIPVHMMVELTSNCNLECKHCYKGSNRLKNEKLPTDLFLSILLDLSKNGVRTVELTGGEPLTHPDFTKILDFCIEHFSFVGLLTNGSLIDEKAARNIARYRDKVTVSISVDSYKPEYHDTFRGMRGALKKTIRAIKLLSAYGIEVRVGMDITPDNFRDIRGTLLLAKKVGAKFFGYNPVIPVGNGKCIKWELKSEDIKEIAEHEIELAREHKGFLTVMPEKTVKELEKIGNCGVGYRTCVLGPTGKIRPCVVMPEEYMTMGDLTKESIEKVFANPLVKYLQNLHAPNKVLCGKCKSSLYCRNCSVRAIFTNEKLDRHCKWFKRNKLERWVTYH